MLFKTSIERNRVVLEVIGLKSAVTTSYEVYHYAGSKREYGSHSIPWPFLRAGRFLEEWKPVGQ